MNFQLQPVTEPGLRFVELAERHAVDFAARADEYDRKGVFPFENIEDLKRSGALAATVPAEYGGLGVGSVHDLALGINRLGRGDGSTAIGVTMHLFRPWRMTRWLKAAREAGDAARIKPLEDDLKLLGGGNKVIAALLSEAGTDLASPLVEAKKTDGGWLISGEKIFGTMSEAADTFELTCRVWDGNAGYRRAVANVPSDSPGITSRGDWDALGMRGSGSHTIVFSDCFVPDSAVVVVSAWGAWNEGILVSTGVINIALMAAFLGIAETARDIAVETAKNRKRGPDQDPPSQSPSIRQSIAEIEIELAASRAMLGRTATIFDEFLGGHDDGDMPFEELKDLAKDVQCSKWFVTRRAIDVVDKAMTVSGGSGYLSSSTLSRLYRDVRAGPLMQPFSPNEAFDFIGKVTLGLDI